MLPLNRADLLIVNGLELEVGWLPPPSGQLQKRKDPSRGGRILRCVDRRQTFECPRNGGSQPRKTCTLAATRTTCSIPEPLDRSHGRSPRRFRSSNRRAPPFLRRDGLDSDRDLAALADRERLRFSKLSDQRAKGHRLPRLVDLSIRLARHRPPDRRRAASGDPAGPKPYRRSAEAHAQSGCACVGPGRLLPRRAPRRRSHASGRESWS